MEWIAPRCGADGDFGTETNTAPQASQTKVGLPITNYIDEAVLTKLAEHQPVVVDKVAEVLLKIKALIDQYLTS